MAQLIITSETGETHNLQLSAAQVTIGRKQENMICLPHLSVSAFHARISTEAGCQVLEDLNSTNGTMVNGVDIKRHVLTHRDEIAIGTYEAQYSETFAQPVPANQSGNNVTPMRAVKPLVDPQIESIISEIAALRVDSGPRAGDIMVLEKQVTTVGRKGDQAGAIARKATGYYFVPLCLDAGRGSIKHNGNGLSPTSEIKLATGDNLEIAGARVEFIYPYYRGS